MSLREEVLEQTGALRLHVASGNWLAAGAAHVARERLLAQLVQPVRDEDERRARSRLILELLEGDRRLIEQLSAARDEVAAELRRGRQCRSALAAYTGA